MLKKIKRKLRRAILRDEPGYYDMFLNPGERFLARLYLHEIRRRISEGETTAWFPPPGSSIRQKPSVPLGGVSHSPQHTPLSEGRRRPLEILDAGCQAGRLSVPLASAGHRVTGVDTSAVGLRRAERHAREAQTPLRLVRADLGKWLPRAAPASFDAVVCTEVLYLRPNHRELLEGLLRVLRPGGFCFISHRPAGYYLAEAVGRRDWQAVETILTRKEGKLFGSYYNWQEREELERTYAGFGLTSLRITPVGLLGWLVVQPDQLTEPEQENLFRAELALAEKFSHPGRYLLVSGRKNA